MNKTALKNFATQSRRKLIEQVKTKALLYGIDENNGLHIEEQFGQLLINGQTYSLSMKTAFSALQKQFEQKGYRQLLEEAAYTWFNRIIAIRYMEVHEYLPERVNVLSSSVGRVDPDILFEYDTMDLTIKYEEIRELINAGNTEAAYRILFVAQCNALNRILPFMFEQIQDYTELLLPDFLLDAESVIKTLVQSEELTESFSEIEVIGWLYQYYIAEEKDRVFAQKSKYKKEEIPFATQLFTPKWIVQYMVQNSLGRYWTEAHREDEDLIDNWEYFIKHEEADFHEKIAPFVNKELKVEDIKLLDPAMGSGHILVYAFEVFYEIYEKCGYPERDIPRLILENNLYGLDIDDRAYQLAAFAVVMKATSYSKRFLRSVEREGIQLKLASIQETNHISEDVIAYIAQQEVGDQYNHVKAFFDQYHNAKTYGSLINITERDISFIEERLEKIQNNPVKDLFYGEQHEIAKQVLPALIHQTKIMRNEYDVVVMNPPYMGSSKMTRFLSDYLKENYSIGKADLFSAFMLVNHYFKKNSFLSVINQHSWMFLYTFKELREFISINRTVDTMLHLGPRTFEEISGEVVQSTTFVLRNSFLPQYNSKYCKLTHLKNSDLKKQYFLNEIQKNKVDVFIKKVDEFQFYPDKTMCFWAGDNIKELYKFSKSLGDLFEVKSGIMTGKDPLHLRLWYEVEKEKIKYNSKSYIDMQGYKWFPINKGGELKTFYGNNQYIVNLENDGEEIKKTSTNYRLRDKELYFVPGITWSRVSTSNIAFRESIEGILFGDAGPVIFIKDPKIRLYLLGFLNSVVAKKLLNYMNPTLNYQIRDIEQLPILSDTEGIDYISKLTSEDVLIAKKNWDSQETSWDFSLPRLLTLKGEDLGESYKNILDEYEKEKSILSKNILLINKYFSELYGLENLFSSFEDKEAITLIEVNQNREAKALISYFIGGRIGRFNHGNINQSNEIIMLTESKLFELDIVDELKIFLKKEFNESHLNDNLKWLSQSLGNITSNNESPEEIIYKYIYNEFILDHNKMYQSISSKQKYPIYWLVDSGKQKGLRALIYMHRYQPDTMAKIRFEHLQEIQAKYQQEIADLENRLVNPNLSATDKKKLNTEKVSFEKKIDELREFDKRLAAIAAEEIEIDLDVGVKVNYEKFYRGGKGVLAKIK
ncbi:BREX-1 system adenine-specific DNA-methyltransferase PglX [Solibacillus daqui]|uniref:BREX-1 system adenine-specific DNA-methyltransferase PglX n=1 Tax=Solibacillus daqui TaxID=2912187 RepID=UPI002367153D|nr:BREX-1 system adenine-specific DNA-methyltransferase PglX [Solibacillus daqui]